ncbi:unnamed protein product, partial [Trichogramma brassicae]
MQRHRFDRKSEPAAPPLFLPSQSTAAAHSSPAVATVAAAAAAAAGEVIKRRYRFAMLLGKERDAAMVNTVAAARPAIFLFGQSVSFQGSAAESRGGAGHRSVTAAAAASRVVAALRAYVRVPSHVTQDRRWYCCFDHARRCDYRKLHLQFPSPHKDPPPVPARSRYHIFVYKKAVALAEGQLEKFEIMYIPDTLPVMAITRTYIAYIYVEAVRILAPLQYSSHPDGGGSNVHLSCCLLHFRLFLYLIYAQKTRSRLLIHPLQSARGKSAYTGARRGSSTWSSCSSVICVFSPATRHSFFDANSYGLDTTRSFHADSREKERENSRGCVCSCLALRQYYCRSFAYGSEAHEQAPPSGVKPTRRTESVNIIHTGRRATQLTEFLYKIFISASVAAAATSAAARTRVAEHNKERETPLSRSSSTVIRNYTRAWACVVLCTRERPPKNASARPSRMTARPVQKLKTIMRMQSYTSSNDEELLARSLSIVAPPTEHMRK